MPPKKIQLTVTMRDQQHFLQYYNQNNKKLVIIDVHPSWCGPCQALFGCYKNLQTQIIDQFQKRVDIILIDQQKLINYASDKFKTTSRPKILLSLQGKIIHQVAMGPNISDLQQHVKKHVPYL